MTCPHARAWSDEASATDVAHNLAECSNRGLCDRTTGMCACESGRFEGAACERKTCTNTCNGHGRCQSMSYYASLQVRARLPRSLACPSLISLSSSPP